MIIPDVNLLVYAYNSDAPHHQRAKEWWEPTVRGHQPVAMATALQHLRSWLEQPSVHVLQPGPRHLTILAGFCEAGVLSSALLSDAHIAALAIENQATVHSNDSDFCRFPGLRWSNPLNSTG